VDGMSGGDRGGVGELASVIKAAKVGGGEERGRGARARVDHRAPTPPTLLPPPPGSRHLHRQRQVVPKAQAAAGAGPRAGKRRGRGWWRGGARVRAHPPTPTPTSCSTPQDFKKPAATAVAKRLAAVCAAQGLQASDATLQALAEGANCDLRSLIGQLQLVRLKKRSLSFDDATGRFGTHKDATMTPFDAARLLADQSGKHLSLNARLDAAFVDLDMVPLLVQVRERGEGGEGCGLPCASPTTPASSLSLFSGELRQLRALHCGRRPRGPPAARRQSGRRHFGGRRFEQKSAVRPKLGARPVGRPHVVRLPGRLCAGQLPTVWALPGGARVFAVREKRQEGGGRGRPAPAYPTTTPPPPLTTASPRSWATCRPPASSAACSPTSGPGSPPRARRTPTAPRCART